MKKFVSLLLAVCTSLSVGVMLAACGHEHTYQTEWSKDTTHHWHACEGEDCAELSAKAEHLYGNWGSVDATQHKKTCECGAEIVENHDWNDGEITTAPTTTSKGVMTYKCKYCEYTYTADIDEIVPTVTETEWETALDLRTTPHVLLETITDSFGKTSISTVKYSIDKVYQSKTSSQEDAQGVIIAEIYYYIEGEKCYCVSGKLSQEGTLVYEKEESTIERFDTLKNSINNLAIKFPSVNFVYDEEAKAYRFTGELKVDGYDVTDATIRFENGKVVSIETYRLDKQNRQFHNVMVFTYESPQIDIPEATEKEGPTILPIT